MCAKIVGEVAIDVTADVGPLARQMKKGESSLNGFESRAHKMAAGLGKAMGIGAVSAGGMAVAMVALTRASMQNIDVLAKQARAIGLTVSSFQAMTMVAEEAGVEAEALSKMLVKMQDNIAQLGNGTKAQTEQFERLGLSISDLAGLSAEEQFKKITEALNGVKDPAQKTAAALDVFGKSGSAAINMLDGYSSKLDEARAFQERFGIAVSQASAEKVEAANDAVGRLSTVMEGLGNRMATTVAPAIEGTANALVDFAGSVMGIRIELEQFFGTLQNARNMLGEDVFNRLLGNPALIREVADTLDQVNASFLPVGDAARAAVPELRAVADMLDYVEETGAAQVLNSITDEMESLHVEFAEGKVEAEEFAKKMEVLAARANGVITEMQGIDGVDFSGVIGRLGGLTSALSSAWATAKRLRAELPGGSAEMTTGTPLSGDVADLMPPSALAPGSSIRPQRPGLDSDVFGIPAKGGGKKSGGGGSDPMTARIEALIESLKTEQEILAEWYATSLEALNAASEAELLAVGGKHEAMERLEEEHQKRLADIREMGNQWGVEAALSGGAEILNAVGQTNKKALKAAKIFSAAQAMISTYEGAAKELKKGTLGFASAAAVIAKGIGFVSAIRGVSGSGGGGGRVGSSGATSSVTENRTANIHFYGGFEPTSATMDVIAKGLNNWLGDGGVLNVKGMA